MARPDVVDQIIVGFNKKLEKADRKSAEQAMDDVLSRLTTEFGATVIDRLITAEKDPFFAIAIITLEGTTLEALQEIRDAKTPFVIAINKIDKPNADMQRTIASLLEQNVFLEKYGGDVPWAAISAKVGTGVEELLDQVAAWQVGNVLLGTPPPDPPPNNPPGPIPPQAPSTSAPTATKPLPLRIPHLPPQRARVREGGAHHKG